MLSSENKQNNNVETFKLRFKSHYIACFPLIAMATALVYLTVDINGSTLREKGWHGGLETRKDGDPDVVSSASNETAIPGCDLFSGRWIYDAVSRPLYEEGQCSFLEDGFACEKYGRKDVDYQKWRWQPHHCDLPRFDGRALLEKMRGKRVVFVGDSLNQNQWASLLCLIESSLDQSFNKSVIRNDNLFIFKATEYNATIEFYWSPLLVESNCDDPNEPPTGDRTVRITSIEKHAKHWTDADILIFDSFMWWLEPTMTLLWGSFGSSGAIYKRVEMKLRRYEMALNTWSDWLEININQTKTKLFFMSLSPYHSFVETWDESHNCYNETKPITKEGGYWGITTDGEMMRIAESVIEKLEKRGTKITYLNITNLSDYRNDGHPSIYTQYVHPPSLANPRSYSDCIH